MKLITFLARLAGTTVRKEVEESQVLSRRAKKKLEDIIVTYQKLKENQSDFSKLVLRRSFDPHVKNRPLVGNAPVQTIKFLDAKASVDTIIKMVDKLDWAMCNTILNGNSIGRI
jgi:hypothetical protein